jgi:hypothetical protein
VLNEVKQSNKSNKSNKFKISFYCIMDLKTDINLFILFTIFIKIVFILSAVGHIILTHVLKKTDTTNSIDAKFMLWKERTEFIFIISMSMLLIYYFRPGHLKPINNETALLFFLFGWILIITAKWNDFITGAKWYSAISQS